MAKRSFEQDFERAKAAVRKGSGRGLRFVHGSVAKPKLEAVSKSRWRASASERRLYGGSTVTEFWVYLKGDPRPGGANTVVVKAYGKTPGERKSNALRKGERLLREKGILPSETVHGMTRKPKHIEIRGTRWRDSYGNTYHKAYVYADGKMVAKEGPTYGYGDQYLETGWAALEANRIVPARTRSRSGSLPSPWREAERLGIKLDYSAKNVQRKKDL